MSLLSHGCRCRGIRQRILLICSFLQHYMEINSPQLAEEDGELWLEFIKRDIPDWKDWTLPKNTNRWYEFYCDLRESAQRSLDADAEKLKAAIDGIQSERARLTPKIIAGPAGKRSRKGATGGSKKNANSIFAPQRRNNALAVPTKELNTRASRVTRAPKALVEDHRRPVEQPDSKRSDLKIRVPGARRASGGTKGASPPSPANGGGYTAKEKQARLQALMSSKPMPMSSRATITRKATSPPKEGSPVKKTQTLKRPASPAKEGPVKKTPALKRSVSPPPAQSTSVPRSQAQPPRSRSPQSAPLQQTPPGASNSPPPRPMILRKKPADPFIRPKKRRVA